MWKRPKECGYSIHSGHAMENEQVDETVVRELVEEYGLWRGFLRYVDFYCALWQQVILVYNCSAAYFSI